VLVALWVLGKAGVHPPAFTLGLVEATFTCLAVGAVLAGFDLFVLYNVMKPPHRLLQRPVDGLKVAVGLTAYDDEASIGAAVAQFKAHPRVSSVVVIDNNCRDGTARVAAEAGAEVVAEARQGFGWACRAALDAAAARGEIVVLAEGDGTFDARDLDKMLAYLVHFDVVMGSRTTRELSSADSQMDWLLNPFNQIVAKLLQLRFWGTRLSDVGCTFRVLRREAWERVRGAADRRQQLQRGPRGRLVPGRPALHRAPALVPGPRRRQQGRRHEQAQGRAGRAAHALDDLHLLNRPRPRDAIPRGGPRGPLAGRSQASRSRRGPGVGRRGQGFRR
jgi:hypothetical protein